MKKLRSNSNWIEYKGYYSVINTATGELVCHKRHSRPRLAFKCCVKKAREAGIKSMTLNEGDYYDEDKKRYIESGEGRVIAVLEYV